jgi:hypothetical protein
MSRPATDPATLTAVYPTRPVAPFPVGALIEQRPNGPRFVVEGWRAGRLRGAPVLMAELRHLATDKRFVARVTRATHRRILRADWGGFGPAVYEEAPRGARR